LKKKMNSKRFWISKLGLLIETILDFEIGFIVGYYFGFIFEERENFGFRKMGLVCLLKFRERKKS